MRADYLIAARYSGLPVVRNLAGFWRNGQGDMSEACARAGRLQAGKDDDPHGVYDFYRGFWTAITNVAVLLFISVGLLLKALHITTGHRPIAVLLLAPCVSLLLGSMTILGMGILRTSRILSPGVSSSEFVENLKETAPDFWLAVLVATVAMRFLSFLRFLHRSVQLTPRRVRCRDKAVKQDEGIPRR